MVSKRKISIAITKALPLALSPIEFVLLVQNELNSSLYCLETKFI